MAGAEFYAKQMEEAEVPLESLHEEIHHHAEHGGPPWISGVALSTAILAVLAAITGLLSGKHANEAMMDQIRRSEEHTSELQSPCNLVCRLLLEKKKYTT